MPVALSHIRDQLLPGLWEIRNSEQYLYEHREVSIGYSITRQFIEPRVSLPVAVAMGVAAAVVANPTVTRRFFSWLLRQNS